MSARVTTWTDGLNSEQVSRVAAISPARRLNLASGTPSLLELRDILAVLAGEDFIPKESVKLECAFPDPGQIERIILQPARMQSGVL